MPSQRVKVMFNNPSVSTSADELEEENDYINTAVWTVNEETPASDEKTPSPIIQRLSPIIQRLSPIIQRFSPIAVCWGILLLIMVLRIYYTSVITGKLREQTEGSELADLYCKYIINKLNVTIQNLERSHSSLEAQIQEKERARTVLESRITSLRENYKGIERENQGLKTENQRLKTENRRLEAENQKLQREQEASRTTLTPRYTNDFTTHNPEMMTKLYRRKKRQSEPCEPGWQHFQSSCYEMSHHDPPDHRTWEEARYDCRGKNADLVVIESPEEQGFISHGVAALGHSGFWIGLRVEGGSWKWVSGDDLTTNDRTEWPADNHLCVISVGEPEGWQAVSCDLKNGWICEMRASSF
ncbi:asialoglycoprotein receptor 2 [Xyrichtys novacula]|uniref:Asialoglycoprotein receptor 2 n=1 Tax=Xyrichtys novacula TaxID=13765 RepID=A0AAV1G1I6_XYRNO|nr:asialoglycoprotein receptor 2 [Xyrichtys novacula]